MTVLERETSSTIFGRSSGGKLSVYLERWPLLVVLPAGVKSALIMVYNISKAALSYSVYLQINCSLDITKPVRIATESVEADQ